MVFSWSKGVFFFWLICFHTNICIIVFLKDFSERGECSAQSFFTLKCFSVQSSYNSENCCFVIQVQQMDLKKNYDYDNSKICHYYLHEHQKRILLLQTFDLSIKQSSNAKDKLTNAVKFRSYLFCLSYDAVFIYSPF